MKVPTLFFFFALLLCTACAPGNGATKIGHQEIFFYDSARNNRLITVEVFYPADPDGQIARPVAAGRFPVLAFGHGFVMSWTAYKNFVDWLVPEGYILVFPAMETSISPSHLDLARDLAATLRRMAVLGRDTTSPFFGHIDSMNCVMGHSMGGGSAFLAAAEDPSIRSLATFAAARTNPSAIGAAGCIHVPALVFFGTNDCITPPSTDQIPMFDAIPAKGKYLISIKGGSHCLMANKNFACGFGESTCKPKPEISRAQQHEIIKRFLIPWLNGTLKSDSVAERNFTELMRGDTTVVTNLQSSLRK